MFNELWPQQFNKHNVKHTIYEKYENLAGIQTYVIRHKLRPNNNHYIDNSIIVKIIEEKHVVAIK